MDKDSWARAGDEGVPIAASRWASLAHCPEAQQWLRVQADLGLAPRTLDAYSRGLVDYLAVCAREGIEPLSAGRAEYMSVEGRSCRRAAVDSRRFDRI